MRGEAQTRRLGLKQAAMLVAFGVLAALGHARTEPGSFLNRPANSVQELVAQIQSDPEVSNRLMRHFGMSKPALLTMVRGLKLKQLTKNGFYQVYNCREDEVIRARLFVLNKGTWVYVDKNGVPVLKKGCANPFRKGTDFQTPLIPTPEPEIAADFKPMSVEPENSEPLEMMPFAEIATPAFVNETVVENEPPIMLESPPFISGKVIGAGFQFPAGFLPLLSLLVPPGGNPPHNPPPVPEPATMIALGTGVAALIARHRRKAR